MLVVFSFFIIHWYTSLFCQTFFHHRYGAHRQFLMSKRAEKFFFLLTWITQGSSYLNIRAYVIMHRGHHAYSDKEKDPHSPHHSKGFWDMMWKTKKFYSGLIAGHIKAEKRFTKYFPEWKALESIGETLYSRVAFVAVYFLVYLVWANHWWLWFLLPIQIIIGPVQGAIVNWCGHKYGTHRFKTGDKSRNTWWLNLFLLGETNQHNHHFYPKRINFGYKWYEVDPVYPVVLTFDKVGLIQIKRE